MPLNGKQYINGQWQDGTAGQFFAVNPSCGENLAPAYSVASASQVNVAVQDAAAAALPFRQLSLEKRACFLESCAYEIELLGEELLERICAETGYPKARAQGEVDRTTGQLRMFANYIREGSFLDPRIDTALPDRKPLPRPDLRYLNQALGPVVVFGASNFPMAYSVAGGDTVSALAAGCPVIVKAHPSHPGTCELVAQAIVTAMIKHVLPTGVFALVHDNGFAVGQQLVLATAVKAVGFTGSLAGGRALFDLANSRPEPIPVFAEMGAINPVVLMPARLAEFAEVIAKGFVGSLTVGTGQFCVNPGLVVAVKSDGLERFKQTLTERLCHIEAGVMLNKGIRQSFQHGVAAIAEQPAVTPVASGRETVQSKGYYGQAQVFATTAQNFIASPAMQDEVFGPCSLIVECESVDEIELVIACLGGQLSGTLHATDSELVQHHNLIQQLSEKVGRIVINGFPTGVEVCPSTVHGGPYPASTDSRFTSVGTAAIYRFVRPVCYQNFPENLLPDALLNDNPLKLSRVVNGCITREAL